MAHGQFPDNLTDEMLTDEFKSEYMLAWCLICCSTHFLEDFLQIKSVFTV